MNAVGMLTRYIDDVARDRIISSTPLNKNQQHILAANTPLATKQRASKRCKKQYLVRSGRHAPSTPLFKSQNEQLLVAKTAYCRAQLDGVCAERRRRVHVEPDIRKTGL